MSLRQGIETAPELSEQVYDRLLDAICRGELQPGARLTQEELAASLSVSRQPVLQALRLLRRDGIVIDSGRRGLAVAPISAALIRQVYQVRGVLEALAAREAARAGARIDPSAIARGRKAAAGGDFAALIEADIAFHHLIYAAAGNALIAESVDRHWQHIRRATGAVLDRLPGMRTDAWDEHQAMLEAINAGDAARAERLALAHCDNAGRLLAARLEQDAPPAP